MKRYTIQAMPYPLDEATATAIVSLYPWTRTGAKGREDWVQKAVGALLEAEQRRRGQPDPLTGALSVAALTQGELLRQEYDLSTHAHHDGWTVGAVAVDVKEMIGFNARFGFSVGDALLRAVSQSLAAQYPGAKVVRTHGDGFAALLVPTSGLTVSEDLAATTREGLTAAAREVLPEDAPAEAVPGFTVALLELTVVQPSHWQVLGPLVWAEVERAYLMERTGRAHGLQRRRLQLDAALPEATPRG